MSLSLNAKFVDRGFRDRLSSELMNFVDFTSQEPAGLLFGADQRLHDVARKLEKEFPVTWVGLYALLADVPELPDPKTKIYQRA